MTRNASPSVASGEGKITFPCASAGKARSRRVHSGAGSNRGVQSPDPKQKSEKVSAKVINFELNEKLSRVRRLQSGGGRPKRKLRFSEGVDRDPNETK